MTPDHPYLQIIPGAFESSAIAAVWLFLPSMKADVADWDELHTTRRREGRINSFYSWFIKASLTCSMGVGGLVLPIAIWSVAIASAWFYPLTRRRAGEIRAELEARRGRIQSTQEFINPLK